MRWRDLERGVVFMLGMFAADYIRLLVGFPTHLTFGEELTIVCTLIVLTAIREKK